jgi:hypothetical protein
MEPKSILVKIIEDPLVKDLSQIISESESALSKSLSMKPFLALLDVMEQCIDSMPTAFFAFL